MTQRLVYVKHFDAAVCDTCRTLHSHATCRRCGRHRTISSQMTGGGHLCADCDSDTPLSHPCPDCGTVLPGGGKGRCRECLAEIGCEREHALNCGKFASAYGAQVFDQFWAWLGTDRKNPKTPRMIGQYAQCLSELELAFDVDGRIDQDTVLQCLGVEGARRGQRVIDFLVDTGRLDWSQARTSDWNEQRRIETLLTESDATPFGPIVQSYFSDLTDRPDNPLAPLTVRTYLSAAIRFLEHAGVGDLNELKAGAFERFLRVKPGLRNGLSVFRRFTETRTNNAFTIPKKRPISIRKTDVKLDLWTKRLRRELEKSDRPAQRRALVIALISHLYLLPLNVVTTLHPNQISRSKKKTVLRTPMGDFPLRSWLGDALEEVILREGQFAFPGRGLGRSLSPASLAHHLLPLRQSN